MAGAKGARSAFPAASAWEEWFYLVPHPLGLIHDKPTHEGQ